MTIMFHEGNRRLQENSKAGASPTGSRRLTRTAFSADDQIFIEGAAYFFLATADAQGRPDALQGRDAGLRARDRRERARVPRL